MKNPWHQDSATWLLRGWEITLLIRACRPNSSIIIWVFLLGGTNNCCLFSFVFFPLDFSPKFAPSSSFESLKLAVKLLSQTITMWELKQLFCVWLFELHYLWYIFFIIDFSCNPSGFLVCLSLVLLSSFLNVSVKWAKWIDIGIILKSMVDEHHICIQKCTLDTRYFLICVLAICALNNWVSPDH